VPLSSNRGRYLALPRWSIPVCFRVKLSMSFSISLYPYKLDLKGLPNYSLKILPFQPVRGRVILEVVGRTGIIHVTQFYKERYLSFGALP
jgi:hypothetical protein